MEMDLHNPVTEEEDCELKSFARLSARLKEFPSCHLLGGRLALVPKPLWRPANSVSIGCMS